MIHIGVYNELIVDRILAPGAFLIDNKGNDVLLPNKYIPTGMKIGDQLKVFIYNDSEDRIVATTLRPLLQLHEFGYLKVKDINNIGAFLDWGLEKDLLVPFRQQHKRLNIGQWCLVYLYIDTLTHRLAATTKVDKHFEKENIELEVNQEVNLLITNESDLGVNVIINNTYSGMIFRNQIYKDIMIGDHMKGFIEQVRSDGKIDVSLRKKGMKNLEAGAQIILNELRASNGFIALTDKSTPEEIQSILQMSKKNFKKSLGILYRNKQVLLKKEGVLLRKIEEN
jgi:predicted RNA-binding protein (virulence factor B family)